MNKKIGIIGTGNMGSAIIRGICESDTLKECSLIIYDVNTKSAEISASADAEIILADSISFLAENSEIVIIAVKPDIYPYVLDEIKGRLASSCILVSIAAGVSLEFVEGFFQFPVKVVRTMPNTPLLVGEGMTAVCGGRNTVPEDISSVQKIFGSLGMTEVIEEKYFDVYTALAGSSPAYIYMLIEAMADGGVLEGFSRESAYRIISQAVKGAAEMVNRTGKHPGELKDMVCSPGGTTMEAVASLEESGFRSSLIKAVKACSEKSRSMKK